MGSVTFSWGLWVPRKERSGDQSLALASSMQAKTIDNESHRPLGEHCHKLSHTHSIHYRRKADIPWPSLPTVQSVHRQTPLHRLKCLQITQGWQAVFAHWGDLAQLVERRPQDPMTRGSNPIINTRKRKKSNKKIGQKSCADSSVCPNPSVHILYALFVCFIA